MTTYCRSSTSPLFPPVTRGSVHPQMEEGPAHPTQSSSHRGRKGPLPDLRPERSAPSRQSRDRRPDQLLGYDPGGKVGWGSKFRHRRFSFLLDHRVPK